MLKRGDILHRWFNDTTPPKNKFFVVMGEDENNIIGFFFINSDINNYIKRNQTLLDMQMSIKKVDYPFLTNSFSYICAHEIKPINKAILHDELESGTTERKGHLRDEDLSLLLDAVRDSKLFSKIEKETYFS